MWPMLLDMTRDESKRILRRLELEAYSNVVSTLRAQGELNDDKRKILEDLSTVFKISSERHRAEVRRAVNDEKLTTIAEHLAGANTSSEWSIEGRRSTPLLPRLVPQTAFTALANNVANATVAENAQLPPPFKTVRKQESTDVINLDPNIPEASKTALQSINQTITIPSGGGLMGPPPMPQTIISTSSIPTIIPVRRKIEEEEEDREDHVIKKRKSSVDEQPASPPLQTKVSASSIQQGGSRTVPFAPSPVKITLTTARPTVTTTNTTSTTQKVIIVSNPPASGSPSILHRSLSLPIVKTVSPTGSAGIISQPRGPSLIINNAGNPPSSVSNIVTISTNPAGTSSNITATTGIPAGAFVMSQGSISKIHPKTVHLPSKPRPRSNSIVIPVTPNSPTVTLAGSGATTVHLKTPIQSAGLKVIPSTSGTTKILPKPASFTSSAQTPLYVMSTTTSGVSMITRTVPSASSPRVMTMTTSANAASAMRPVTTLISKNTSKPGQTLHISSQNPVIGRNTSGKPNVIVVQKGSGFTRGVTLQHGGKEVVGKVIMGKPLTTASTGSSMTTMTIQKQNAGGNQPVTQSINIPSSSNQGNVIVLDLSQEQLNKNSVLAEILQASGILGDQLSSVIRSSPPEKEKPIGIPVTENSGPSETDRARKCVVKDVSSQSDSLMDPGKVMTLQEAVDLLGQSDTTESRTILGPSGIQSSNNLSTSTATQVKNIDLPIIQKSSAGAGSELMEVVGHLDPHTGIYSIAPPLVRGTESKSQNSSITMVPGSVSVNTAGSMDIFSTALATADINLDSFQYLDERLGDMQSTTQEVLDGDEKDLEENDVVEDPFTSFGKTNISGSSISSTAVTVEPSQIDTSEMHIEDFASQKFQDENTRN